MTRKDICPLCGDKYSEHVLFESWLPVCPINVNDDEGYGTPLDADGYPVDSEANGD